MTITNNLNYIKVNKDELNRGTKNLAGREHKEEWRVRNATDAQP